MKKQISHSGSSEQEPRDGDRPQWALRTRDVDIPQWKLRARYRQWALRARDSPQCKIKSRDGDRPQSKKRIQTTVEAIIVHSLVYATRYILSFSKISSTLHPLPILSLRTLPIPFIYLLSIASLFLILSNYPVTNHRSRAKAFD